MGAPVGNEYWRLRSKHGRNHRFTAKQLEAACETYIDWHENNPLTEEKAFCYQGEIITHDVKKLRAMTLEGLYAYLKIGSTSWDEWRDKKDFAEIITRVEQTIYNQKFQGAAAGLLDSNIIARQLGLADKKEVTAKIKEISADPLTDAEWEEQYAGGK